MIKVGTICSGIGAPEKALRNLGIKYELSYFCEFDKFAVKSYCVIHGYNPSKNLGDLTKVDISELPHDLDLLVGGTPCQDFSQAGLRNGGEIGSGTRSSLMWNFVEIIRETQPKAVLWENVVGCLTDKMRPNYDKFINALRCAGYKVNAQILNSKDFGVPQNRERVFVLATRKDIAVGFEYPVGYDCGIRLKDVLEKSVDEKYFLSDKQVSSLKNRNFKQRNFDHAMQNIDGTCATITAVDYKEPKCIELTKGQSQGNRVYSPNGVSVTLSANGGGLGAKTGLYQVPQGDCKGGFREVDNCPTITTSAFQENNFVIDIKQKVKVRKHEVDIPKLQECLRQHKTLTNIEIAEHLNKPLTLVEHWFRKDKSFAIPSEDVWLLLKKLLNIKTNKFDKSIMEFEIKDNVFGMSNRAYSECGVSPTITASNVPNVANLKKKLCNYLIKNGLVKENDVIRHSYSTKRMEQWKDRNVELNNISPTLDTRCDCLGVCKDYRIRKLTPKECFRLMGFTDDDFSACEKIGVSNAQLYKQAGNSIVVNVLMAIFGQLYGVEWKKKVYGEWYKSEQDLLADLPLLKGVKNGN